MTIIWHDLSLFSSAPYLSLSFSLSHLMSPVFIRKKNCCMYSYETQLHSSSYWQPCIAIIEPNCVKIFIKIHRKWVVGISRSWIIAMFIIILLIFTMVIRIWFAKFEFQCKTLYLNRWIEYCRATRIKYSVVFYLDRFIYLDNIF